MRLERRGAARNGWRRIGFRNTAEGAIAGCGAAIAIGAMEWFSLASHYPLVIIPFATSIVLVIGSPEAEPPQPRALIGGHVVATLAGLAMLQLTGPQAWAAAAVVGVAIVAMVVTGTFHPPAGINPLLVVSNNLPGHSCSRRCLRAPCY
jgi:CBS-domain-containing membrane protein